MKYRAFIGIEISAEEVRGAYVRSSGGAAQLMGVASTPLPQGSMDPDGMINSQEASEAIKRVCSELDSKINHIVVGMTGCSLVARVMEIPPVPDSEVRSVLRGEMDHYRILPAGQSAFDFFRLPELPERPGQEVQEEPVVRVLLMGAEERLVASYREAADRASLNLVAIEPGSIALLRSLYPMLCAEGGVASILVTQTGTDIFITLNGELQFYRRIDTGIPELHSYGGAGESVAAQQNRGGLLITGEDAPEVEIPALQADIYNRQAISLLMTEVQRSIDFYIREFPQATDSMSVRFAVDCKDAEDLFNVMSQYLRTSSELASVSDTLAVSPDAGHILTGPQGFRYTVAVGLALRGITGYEGSPTLDMGIGDKVVVERRMAPKAMLASVGASAVILLGTVASAFVIGHNISSANRTLTQTRSELDALRQEHAAKVARLDRQKQITGAIQKDSKPIREAVHFLSWATSGRAALTSLALEPGGQIFISGETLTPRHVADVMDRINSSSGLEPVRLNSLARVDQNGHTSLRFELQTGFAAPVVQAAAPQTAPAGSKQGGS